MLIKVFLALSGISPYVKKLLWKQWYQFLAGHHKRLVIYELRLRAITRSL